MNLILYSGRSHFLGFKISVRYSPCVMGDRFRYGAGVF